MVGRIPVGGRCEVSGANVAGVRVRGGLAEGPAGGGCPFPTVRADLRLGEKTRPGAAGGGCRFGAGEVHGPLDESNPKPGRVVAGALEGRVEIRGAKGLAIHTRNVNFSEAALRVWSDEPIEFQYGVNKGRGLGLELDLIPGPPTDDKPGVAGVRTMRVRRDVTLNLASKPKAGRKPEQLTITSAGNFEYQLEAKLATFREQVHVEHPGDKGLVDTLDCHELVVVFEPKKKAEPPNAAAPVEPAKVADAAPGSVSTGENGSVGEDEDLDFRRLRGVADLTKGQPARLVSPRGGLVALCGEITYDRVLRVATLRDGQQVLVTQKNNELRCPRSPSSTRKKGGSSRRSAAEPAASTAMPS